MFFELRQYRTLPGQRNTWVKFMEEEIIPFQVAKGMVILGSFVGQEEDDLSYGYGALRARRNENGCTKRCTKASIGKMTLPPKFPPCWIAAPSK